MKPLVLLLFFALFILLQYASAIQILSKSKLRKCEKISDSNSLNCTNKIIIDLAVPSDSSGNEASLIAEIVEVEDNSSSNMRTLRVPPVITINKSAAYALYELTYIRDIAYKPQEFYVNTRKCQPDAGADVVQICERVKLVQLKLMIGCPFLVQERVPEGLIQIEKENTVIYLSSFLICFHRLRDENGHIIENTQPTCCPCGDQRRVPSSCGNFYLRYITFEVNAATVLSTFRFHVFGIGQRSVGFSIRIDVKKQSQNSEVTVGPDNRTATSSDKFLRVNLIGDYVGYTDIPSFDDLYLVIPRQGGPGQPQNLGSNFSMWMLLERVRFTLDGVECNKIGVGYDAFNAQPDFCSAPFWSCLHNQLWNFWDADQNRISRNQVPLYCVQGRFERINQHPVTFQNAGSHAFSIGITEVLNTNLLIELNADDIEYVYQRSPGKILSITIPTFEALTQFGTATITTKNIGEVEASYSLTDALAPGRVLPQFNFEAYSMLWLWMGPVLSDLLHRSPSPLQSTKFDCSAGVSQMEVIITQPLIYDTKS
uniref:Generative cell specific-1/HAP2 domain-containing protein n=1 Tax=Solanum lycopersicum TaxID=4081 RepID=A0A3Q7HTV9_SOLLC